MREELKGPKVDHVAVAVVMDEIEGEKEFCVYLVNFRDDIMEGIIISSTGYGENAQTGEKIKTSTLRHSLEVLLPNEAAKIEPIMPDLFGLTNEYWVSFWVNETMYDKRFIFPAESISEKKMKYLEHFKKPGVIIK
ncbi:MAG TPA: hypothetical protein DEF82_06715 [Crocinitomicaceae bacterium]|nr:hypothetical protein [Flavobacteriales bacterium]HBW86427.1 hypothetical protein [Crocinitomicaceae bacterium]